MYDLYLIFTIIVPGSAIPLVKNILVLCYIFYGLISVLKTRNSVVNLGPFLCAVVAVILFSLVGLINNNAMEDVFTESASNLVFVVTLYFLFNGYANSKNAHKIVLAAFAVYLALKFIVFVSAASFTSALSALDVYYTIKEYVPGAVVSSFGAGGTPRIVFSNDFNLPVFIFWLSCIYYFRMISAKVFLAFGFVTLLAILLSLSRYLILFTAVILFFTALMHLKLRTVVVYGVSGVVLLVTLPLVLSYIGYSDLINDRLFGSVASTSNSVKLEQLGVLDLFYSSPVIGQGFGLDLKLADRELRHVFQAEVQWLALLAKTGLIGIIMLVVLLFRVYVHIVRSKRNAINFKINLYIIPILLFWLLAGLANPVLLLTTTSISYMLLYSVFIENAKKRGP